MAYYKCGSIHPTQNSNVVVDTASGSIANFNTPLAMPLLDAQIDVNAVQDLHGQSNPYPAGGGVNKFDKDTMVVSGYYIADTDGKAKPDSGNSCTDYIEINPDTSYYIKTEQTVGQWAAWYDENKDYISGFTMYNRVVTSPSTAKYIRLTILRGESGNINTFSVNYPSTDTAYHPYSNICPISGRSEINLYQLGGNFFNKNTVTNGKLINGSGNEVSYTDWNISDFIPVIEGASYYLYGLTTHPNTNQDNIELFDENKNKVGFANVKTNEQPYLIPSGVKYIKCCVKNPDLDTAQFGVSRNLSYCPYSPYIEKYIINLGDTYYGGYVSQDKDGKRELVVTHDLIVCNGAPNETWEFYNVAQGKLFRRYLSTSLKSTSITASNTLCEKYTPTNTANRANLTVSGEENRVDFINNDFIDLASFKAEIANSPIRLVIPIAEPFTVALPDGEPIKSLPGVNNFFADTGNTAVKFRKIG